jgi:hypothetical protein
VLTGEMSARMTAPSVRLKYPIDRAFCAAVSKIVARTFESESIA